MNDPNPSTTLPEYLQKKSNYELWRISEKKREESLLIKNLPEKEKESDYTKFVGTCSFCKEDCNVLSQMCGQCMRQLNHF